MISGPLRCYGTAKYWNGIMTANPHLGQLIVALGRQQSRAYSKKLDVPKCCIPDPKKKKKEEPIQTCCKDTSQLEGRSLSEWPTSEPPPPAWRCECPYEPQPPNYDPYRIRVPDVVVPPMPPSNVKAPQEQDDGELFKGPEIPNIGRSPLIRDLFHNSRIVHPDYWKDKPKPKVPSNVVGVLPKLGYHGKFKYKYAFHEPWKPYDRLTLLDEAEKAETGECAAEHEAVERYEKPISRGL